jgi:hypothetical protein
MSDLVPEIPFEGIVKVVKLMNGDELLGIVRDVSSTSIHMVLPAKVELGYTKGENNSLLEYVKLTNYVASVANHEILINKNAMMYMGEPTPDMYKMYQTFFLTMKEDPEAIRSSITGIESNAEPGLEMLNELFNNPDFVNFVNDLIDSFEGIEIEETVFDEQDEVEETESLLPESPQTNLDFEEPSEPKKRKKRSRMKPETNGMPFNPEANPNSAESWSDNPEDYL